MSSVHQLTEHVDWLTNQVQKLDINFQYLAATVDGIEANEFGYLAQVPPCPSLTPYFSGRDAELKELHQKISKSPNSGVLEKHS